MNEATMQQYGIQTRSSYTLDADDFDRLVHDHFAKSDYECVADEEWNNDSEHTTVADGTDYNAEDIAKWERGERYNFVGYHQIVAALVARHVLPAGTYTIQVSW